MTDDHKLLSLAMIDKMHDSALTEALGRWSETQEVGVNRLGVSCLRLAALCLAKSMINNKPHKDVECDIIEAYADYFHYYVHVGMDIITEDEKK